MRWAFGDSELDTETFELRRAGLVVPVQRKVFELIRYLLEHRDRAVTKEELFEQVWAGVHVSDSALAWGVSQARKALGQGRAEGGLIETLHGRGYRFRAEVTQAPAREESAVAPPPAPRRPGPPFVGRANVMRDLEQRLEEATRGSGSFLLLTGDAGIGKTRCAEELSDAARARGMRTAWGSCWEGEGAHPFWPWTQIVRSFLEDEEVSFPVRTSAKALLDAQSGRRTEEHARGEPDDEDVFWALDALRELLRTLERERPLFLVLDDLQWADELSLRGLHLLAPDLRRERILVVATVRDHDIELSTTAARTMPRLARHATRIVIAPFSVSEVATYLNLLAGGAPADHAEEMHRRTGGNPLFLREVVREDRAAESGRGSQRLTRVPKAVQEVLRASVARCDAEVRSILEVASAVGDSFEIGDLGDATSLEPDALVAALERAVHAGLLRELPGVGRYAFLHGLLREAVHGDLSVSKKSALHASIATALESRGDLDGTELPRVAYHRHAALPLGEARLAALAASRAAVDARRLNAHADAVQLYGWALDAERLMAPRDPRLRAELLLGLSAAARGTAAEQDARRHAEEAIEIATHHGWTDLLVLGARRLRPNFAWRRAADPVAREALEQALAHLPPDGPHVTRVYALSALAGVPPYSLSAAKSRALSDEARALAQPLGGRARLESLRSCLFSRGGPDDIDELLSISDEILRADAGRSWLSADARWARFPALTYRGDLPRAEEELEAFGELARRFRLGEALWNYDRNRAQFLFMRGRFAEAEALWAELSERASRAGLWYGSLLLPSHRAVLDRERHGTSPLTSEVWTQLWASARGAQRTRASWAMYLAEAGRLEEARRELEAMMSDGVDGIDRDLEYLAILTSLSAAAVLVQDRARAATLYDALLPYERFTTPDTFAFNFGAAALFLARLARFLGRSEEGRRHAAVAVARNTELGLRPRAAESLVELAELLAENDAASARERAQEAARAAAELAMQPIGARAAHLLDRLSR